MIRATQPQWRCLTVDADQGVGLVWGFDQPMSPVSQDDLNYFKALPYESLERDRAGCIGLTPIRYLPQGVGFSVV